MSAASMGGFDLTTPNGRCAFYRLVCQLPAEVDPVALGRIVVRAGSMVWGVGARAVGPGSDGPLTKRRTQSRPDHHPPAFPDVDLSSTS